MIKGKLIELVQKKFTGGNTTPDMMGKYHYKVIEQYLIMGFNQLLGQTFKKDFSNFDRYCKTYKNIAVLEDTDTNTFYSLLPIKVAQLPDTQEGVRRISQMQGSDTLCFVPLKKDSWDIWQDLEAGLITDTCGYSLQGNRVEYEFQPLGISAVKMELVPAFDEYADTDDVPIPAGADAQLFDIIQKLVLGQTNPDKVNDNVPGLNR